MRLDRRAVPGAGGGAERASRRLWAATEARARGRGGIAATARATGISPNTIRKGMRELESGERLEAGRVRRRGGGRKPIARDRSDAARGARGAGRRRLPRRSEPALLVDLQERAQARRRAARARPPGPLSRRSPGCCARSATACRPTARRGGRPASRPRRAVSPHQRARGRGDRGRAAGDLGRHQEEGAGRRLQERRPRVAPQGRARRAVTRTTSQTGSSARRSPTASTTSPPTRAGSTSGSTHDTAQFAVASIRGWWERPRPHALPATPRRC